MESEVEVEEVVKQDDEDRVASPRYVPRMMQQEVRKRVNWISLYGIAQNWVMIRARQECNNETCACHIDLGGRCVCMCLCVLCV